MRHTIIIVVLLGLFGCNQEQELPTVERSGFLEVNDTRLYHQITGKGDTLIILHGGPGLSYRYMKPQLDSLLSEDFTLLYYDQRGSGWSEGEKDTTGLTMNTFVQDLEGVRKHFNLKEVNLLGHSFGGLLAMFYAIEYPTKAKSMVLVDPDAASYALRTPYQIRMINSRISEEQETYLDSLAATTAYQEFDPEAYTQYYKTFLTSYFADPLDTVNLTLGFGSISVPKIRITSKYVRADLGKYDIHDQLPNITSKTLIMQGTESVFSVEGATAIHEGIPNSEIHLFEDCGHFEYIEAPEKFKRIIRQFYAKKQ
jgi:proline iminopeptidase